ncbi:MAG: hypothetical protein J0G98_18040 [Terrimonas ferruginea]|uniref:hypothetical protein n=1 Tax=Terrimonas ferruginea TaxID=249 RepID=UPI001AD2D10C|nr:hypothetical protein [Terrimonas ferruginea]MBN8784965.1 hypothetical protein [Terrimonas ferruginea]
MTVMETAAQLQTPEKPAGSANPQNTLPICLPARDCPFPPHPIREIQSPADIFLRPVPAPEETGTAGGRFYFQKQDCQTLPPVLIAMPLLSAVLQTYLLTVHVFGAKLPKYRMNKLPLLQQSLSINTGDSSDRISGKDKKPGEKICVAK